MYIYITSLGVKKPGWMICQAFTLVTLGLRQMVKTPVAQLKHVLTDEAKLYLKTLSLQVWRALLYMYRHTSIVVLCFCTLACFQIFLVLCYGLLRLRTVYAYEFMFCFVSFVCTGLASLICLCVCLQSLSPADPCTCSCSLSLSPSLPL